jgi:hypothetical protein
MDAQARLMALNIEKKALAKQIRDGAKNFKKKKQRQHEQGSNSMLRVLVLAVYIFVIIGIPGARSPVLVY